MDDLVSIVIPTYNRSEFISDALHSVFQQTHQNLECIVIDGGSTDGTREILQEFQDDRLRLRFREQPHGVASARNVGIESSGGEYIVFLDDDDKLFSNAVETLVETIDAQPLECAGIFAAQRYLDRYGDSHIQEVPHGRVEEYEDVSISGFSCTLIRKEVFDSIGNIDETFPACEDSDLWIRIFSKYFMIGVNEILYERRIHKDQTINDDTKMIEGKRRLLEKHRDRLSESYQITQQRSIIQGLLRLGHYDEARSELRRVIEKDPRKHDYYYYYWLLLGAAGYKAGRTIHHGLYNRLKQVINSN